MTIRAEDWTAARVVIPRFAITPEIITAQGIESRAYVIRDARGESIAETRHAWAASLILSALTKGPRR